MSDRPSDSILLAKLEVVGWPLRVFVRLVVEHARPCLGGVVIINRLALSVALGKKLFICEHRPLLRPGIWQLPNDSVRYLLLEYDEPGRVPNLEGPVTTNAE